MAEFFRLVIYYDLLRYMEHMGIYGIFQHHGSHISIIKCH